MKWNVIPKQFSDNIEKEKKIIEKRKKIQPSICCRGFVAVFKDNLFQNKSILNIYKV